MNEPQLPLFDWPAMVLSEGYRKMAAFHFEEAEKDFNDVLQVRQGSEEEASNAVQACKYWQIQFQKHKENPEVLHKELRQFDFGNTSGLHQLKNALLSHIADRMLAYNRFYLNGDGGDTVTDLLLQTGRHKKAEKVILNKIEKHSDNRLRYSLAQIQWINKQKGEAKKNYALALLLNPCQVPTHRILYKELNVLIEDVGAEMAPAFGWVRGVLPLVPLQDNPVICSDLHRQALGCYRLLWSADKALQKKDEEACFRYRKQLKAEASGLYGEYFELLP